MTRLQIALDTADQPAALRPLSAAIDSIDVIECGTILILHEGLSAVRNIRALYPQKTILADVRIVEAGSIIAKACFEAGANYVSVVAGASLTTIEQVVKVAHEYGGEVQVELADEYYSLQQAQAWREAGVVHAIVKRSRDLEASGKLEWSQKDFERIRELKDLGFTVTVTGGIKAAELDVFAGQPVDIVIAGREIVQADHPAKAAATLRTKIDEIFSTV